MNRLKLILEAYASYKNAQGVCAIPSCSGKPHSIREIVVEQDETDMVTLRAKVCRYHDEDGVELTATAPPPTPAQRVGVRQ